MFSITTSVKPCAGLTSKGSVRKGRKLPVGSAPWRPLSLHGGLWHAAPEHVGTHVAVSFGTMHTIGPTAPMNP